MTNKPVDPRIWAIAETLSGRARLAVEIIRDRGVVTTADVAAAGYEHAPRALADVREAGIPLVKVMVTNPDTGKRMASYTFGDPDQVLAGRFGGRVALPKRLKYVLAARDGVRCAICLHSYDLSNLTVDHRVPYRVGGDSSESADFMLLCRGCQRLKSWACEHCPNWSTADASVCRTCSWASPTEYDHVATIRQRQAVVTFQGDAELRVLEDVARDAAAQDLAIPDYIKARLKGRD